MNYRLDGKMFRLAKRVKRQVMDRLNVDATTVCISSSQDGWSLVFETPVDDTYAELNGILHSDGLEAVLKNFMRNSNVKWSTQEVPSALEEDYDDWCYECDYRYDECVCDDYY